MVPLSGSTLKGDHHGKRTKTLKRNARPDRPYDERDGVDRPGRLPLADIPDASPVRRPDGRMRHVVRHRLRALALPRNGDTAMPSCRRSIPGPVPRTSMRSRHSSPRPMPSNSPVSPNSSPAGPATFTTGSIQGVMVGVTAILAGFLLEPVLARHLQRHLQQPAVHGTVLHHLRLWRGLHRLPGRDRHHGRQHGDQHHPDLGAAGFLGDAIGYRSQHPQGSTGYHLSNGVAVTYQVAQEVVKDDKGIPPAGIEPTASRPWTRTASRFTRCRT